jgi:uncharacterized membrane protein
MTRRTADLVRGIAIAATLILCALALAYARANGVLAADGGEFAARAFGVATGLVLAACGNVIPKRNACIDATSESAAARQHLLRFAGWAFTLAGLAYALIWAFAPYDHAHWAMAPIAAAVLVVVTRMIRLRGLQRGGA